MRWYASCSKVAACHGRKQSEALSMVDGAGDGLDHLGELGAEGSVRLDGARDQLELEMVASNQRADRTCCVCGRRRCWRCHPNGRTC
jgi:hypothetical protein